MHCDDILPLVEKLADGECTEPEGARAEAHMAQCESCREHFRFIRALPEAARKAPLPEPPEAYWDVLPRKVMARIEKGQSTKESRGWLSQILAPPRLRWLGALAAGVIAAVVSYEVLTLERENPPVTVVEPVREPALEEEASQPSKVAPDVVEPAEPAGQASSETGEVLLREPPSSPPAEEAAPTPARASMASPTGTARSREVSEEEVPEPVSQALDAAGRGEAPAETERAMVGVAAEDVREPGGVRAPLVAPPAPRAKAAEPLSRESAKAELGAPETEQLESFRVMKQASKEREGVSPVAFSEKDRETTSVRGAELEAHCRALRDSIDASAEVAKREDIRYQIAKCSFELFQLRQTEDDRLVAEEDASTYLEIFPEGEHADEIKKLLDQISKQ